MEIKLPFDFKQNLRNFLPRCGYSKFIDPYSRKANYTRRLGRDYYPRFHLYIKEIDGGNILSLHLDQKKPSYPGTSAHNAEYSGLVVEKEIQRLQGLIKNQLDNQKQQSPPEKETFWTKLFR